MANLVVGLAYICVKNIYFLVTTSQCTKSKRVVKILQYVTHHTLRFNMWSSIRYVSLNVSCIPEIYSICRQYDVSYDSVHCEVEPIDISKRILCLSKYSCELRYPPN